MLTYVSIKFTCLIFHSQRIDKNRTNNSIQCRQHQLNSAVWFIWSCACVLLAYYILTADIQRRLIEIDLAALNECRHLPVTDNNVYYDRDGGRVKRARRCLMDNILLIRSRVAMNWYGWIQPNPKEYWGKQDYTFIHYVYLRLIFAKVGKKFGAVKSVQYIC